MTDNNSNAVNSAKRVVCFENDTIYKSINAAARATGLSASLIGKCCHRYRKDNKLRKTGGLSWRFM